jgi:cytochrome oxidase Cu insertion factor (SCO1/SenC/PrrC family)
MSGSKSSGPAAPAAHVAVGEPLAMTVHAVAVPDARAGRQATGRWQMIAVLLVCAAPVIASYFTYFVIRPEARTNYSDLVMPPVEIPAALPLVDEQGLPVSARSLKGQWLLVTVAASACNAVCERHLVLTRQLRETLGREKDRLDKVWLITDRAPLRPELARAVADGVPVVTARVEHASLAAWLKPAAGHALEEHLYLVDPMGQWMMRVPPQADPARLKRDIERLLRASSSWDLPGRPGG